MNQAQAQQVGFLPSTPRASALSALAGQLQVEPAKLLACLKTTTFKGATDEELMALCVVANAYGLNPFVKEIYAFPQKGGGIVPVVSVDGWLRIINEHPKFDGMEVSMSPDGEECTVSIYRSDRTRPTVITEHLSECKRGTDPWRTSPKRMLRHKAIIQCARVAFGFGGIHDADDAQSYADDAPRNVTPVKATPRKRSIQTQTQALPPAAEAAPAPVATSAPPINTTTEYAPEPEPASSPDASHTSPSASLFDASEIANIDPYSHEQ